MNKPKVIFIHRKGESDWPHDLLIDEDMNFYKLEKIDGGMSGDFITNSLQYRLNGD